MRKFFLALIVACSFAAPAYAAGGSLTLSASSLNVPVGKTFFVFVQATSGGAVANTVGADISYPADLLTVVSVSRSSMLSVPIASGSVGAGLISIQGGILPARTLSSSKIATIAFKTKKAGVAEIKFASSSGIFANDGAGTDLLKKTGRIRIGISPAPRPARPTIRY